MGSLWYISLLTTVGLGFRSQVLTVPLYIVVSSHSTWIFKQKSPAGSSHQPLMAWECQATLFSAGSHRALVDFVWGGGFPCLRLLCFNCAFCWGCFMLGVDPDKENFYASKQNRLHWARISVPDIFLRLFLSSYLWMSVYPLEPDFTSWCSETTLCLVQWSATPGNG